VLWINKAIGKTMDSFDVSRSKPLWLLGELGTKNLLLRQAAVPCCALRMILEPKDYMAKQQHNQAKSLYISAKYCSLVANIPRSILTMTTFHRYNYTVELEP